MKARLVPLVALVPFLPACGYFANPMGVEKRGYAEVYADLTENAVGSDRVSISTRETLHLFDLEEEWRDDPEAALEKMHEFVYEARSPGLLFALSEVSYHIAERKADGKAYFLLAAVYAYFCILGTDSETPSPFDRRFRIACDLYNRGLAQAMQRADDEPLETRPELDLELPIGSLRLRMVHYPFAWDEGTFDLFYPADQFRVKGLSFRVRSPGLGVPLIALRSDEEDDFAEYVPRTLKLPCTAFLRLEGGARDLESGLTGTFEIHPAYSRVQIRDLSIPLETDITTPLAYMLGEENVVLEGISRFFGKEGDQETGIFMLEPYQKKKIPVLFVHGTASSPATWAEMFNGLNADAYLRDRFQFWFFTYPSGNPVAYSAWRLRATIESVLATLDPEGDDENLKRMVLAGHSQGGMLVRMMVTDGSERFVQQMDLGIDEMELDAQSRELLENCLIFDPSPWVERVVFMSTPHRGSFVAGGFFGRFFKKRVNQGRDVRRAMSEVFRNTSLPRELTKDIPTSVDNMTPDNLFVRTLAAAPIEGVPYHSIIAVHTEGPVERGNDGVVEYKSAHLEGANSELVVKSDHSVQLKSRAIIEIRRILYEHLGERPRARLRPTFEDLTEQQEREAEAEADEEAPTR